MQLRLVAADDVLAGFPAERLGGLVHLDDVTGVGVSDEHGVWRRLQERPIAAARGLEFAFAFRAFGDVLGHRHSGDDGSVVVAYRHDVDAEDAVFEPHLDRTGLAIERPVVQGFQRLDVLRREHVRQPLSLEVRGRDAEVLEPGPADYLVAVVLVEQRHESVRELVDERLVAVLARLEVGLPTPPFGDVSAGAQRPGDVAVRVPVADRLPVDDSPLAVASDHRVFVSQGRVGVPGQQPV